VTEVNHGIISLSLKTQLPVTKSHLEAEFELGLIDGLEDGHAPDPSFEVVPITFSVILFNF
jgi:hypothetical protein